MLYFVYVSEIFKKSSIMEIAGLDTSFHIAKEYHEVLIIESKSDDLVKKLETINPIFIYNILPIHNITKMKEDDYLESLYFIVKRSVEDKKSRIMVQCFNINSKRAHSAKDIEVYIGEKLEKNGYSVDIEMPQRMEYLIILDMVCYSGSMDVKEMFRTHVDPKRFYKNKFRKKISRAELKLEEALDEFGLDLNGGVAIDIGAAPGGWSLILAKRGVKVIAIDPANLDTETFSKENIKVKAVGSSITDKEFAENHIFHIKSVFESAFDIPGPMSNIGIVVIDINTVPEIAIKAVDKMVPLLSKNAVLIMTIKCVTRNVPKYINQAKIGLAENFDTKSIRYLPANRMEVTLYATRK